MAAALSFPRLGYRNRKIQSDLHTKEFESEIFDKKSEKKDAKEIKMKTEKNFKTNKQS